MNVRAAVVAVGLTAGTLAIPISLAAQESLASARQLYASAEYRGALSMLNTLLASSPAPQDRQTIDLYRTFCLVALGSVDDAAAAVDAMITRDPLYHPNLDDVPPRLRTLFRDARRRLLPGIIQQRYVAAKAAFDRNEYRAATEGFTQVLIALSDPDIAPAAGQAPLADIRVLATGFNDLTIRSLAPPPLPQAAAPSAPASAAPSVASSAPPSVRPSAVRNREIYTKDAADVAEPVVIRQALPSYPGRVASAKTAVLDVVIDETGSVESATIVESVDPVYNRLILAATKSWAYQPARRAGAPVKFKKRIQIAISPGSPPAF